MYVALEKRKIWKIFDTILRVIKKIDIGHRNSLKSAWHSLNFSIFAIILMKLNQTKEIEIINDGGRDQKCAYNQLKLKNPFEWTHEINKNEKI